MSAPGGPSPLSIAGVAAASLLMRGLGPLRRELAQVIGTVWYRSQDQEVRERAAAAHRRLDPSLTLPAARLLAHRSHVEYSAMVLDSVWAESQSPQRVARHIVVHNLELLRDPSGSVIAMPHFGNWDMSATGAVANGLAVTTVMGPVVNPFFTALVKRSRERKGLELFSPERAARGLLRALRRRRVVALMADVPEAGPTVTVPYCGGRVLFSAAPARLAQATGARLLPMACWRAGKGWIVHVCEPVPMQPDEGDAAVMARVAASLEPFVRRHPEQWYPFHEVYVDAA